MIFSAMLCLFDSLRFDLQVVPLERATALIGILASSDEWWSREKLMVLLWADVPLEKAQVRLRQLLVRTQSFACFAGLEVERRRVRFVADSDLRRFRLALAAGAWLEAVSWYSGEFLRGLEFAHEPELEAWLLTEREVLRQGFVQACKHASGQLPPAEAFEVLHRACSLEPLEVVLLQALLERASVDVARAERALERHAQQLARLGLQPEANLKRLLEHASKQRNRAFHVLPAVAEVLVGRQAELEEVLALFAAGRRLLTLVGPGGIGKTRLGLEVASRLNLPDGVVFVGLTASASSAEAFVTTVLNTMQVIGRENPFDQLVQVLEGREVLLLLDNFEHLTDLAPLVADLLERCPKLRVLVTSRSTLNLRLEQLYEVVGLPAPDELYPLEEQDSARFFEREVRRVLPQFSWGAHDLAWFSRVHAVVAGSPLGLRLAAGLMRLFSLPQLVTELEQGVDVLHSQVRDAPERHRSLEVVFDSSWQALSADQRAALSNLAILRGSFDLELTRVVTRSSSEVLLGLMNQSMLSKRGERLFLHEAVRQYAARARSLEHSDPVHRRLLAWVEKRLPSAIDGAIGPQEQLHTRWVQLEYDHIRTALTWGLEHEVVRSAELLAAFEPTARRLGHAPELEAWLEHCLGRSEVQGVLRGHCLVAAGECAQARGQFSSVERYAEAALELAERHADRRLEAQARRLRGSGLFEQLEYEACITQWREALRLQQNLGRVRAQGWLHWALTQVCVFAQRFNEAQTHSEACMRLYQQLESQFGIMTALQVQALIHGQRHEYEQERAALLETLPLFEREYAPLDEAYSHVLLGSNAVRRQDYGQARASFARAARLNKEAGYIHGLIYTLADSAFLAHAERHFEQAALLLLTCQNLLRQRGAKYDWHLSEEMLKPHVPPSLWASLERQANDLDLEAALALAEGQPQVSN